MQKRHKHTNVWKQNVSDPPKGNINMSICMDALQLVTSKDKLENFLFVTKENYTILHIMNITVFYILYYSPSRYFYTFKSILAYIRSADG